MAVFSITDYKFYLDVYKENTIVINATTNHLGVLSTDSKSNLLVSTFNCGRQPIIKCTGNANGGIILYNDLYFTFFPTTFGVNDIDKHFLINPTKATNYKISASEISSTSFTGYKINATLTNLNVFKVFVNGIESKSYSHDDTGVTLTSNDVKLITGINDYAVIYAYNDTQTVSNTTTFAYLCPDKIYPLKADVLDGSFFATTTQLTLFDNLSLNQSVTLFDNANTYNYTLRKDRLDTQNKLSLTTYNDLYSTLLDKKFRILCWNEDDLKMYVINNCFMNDPINYSIEKSINNFSNTIDYENLLLIDYTT